jgi:hypothetical protein
MAAQTRTEKMQLAKPDGTRVDIDADAGAAAWRTDHGSTRLARMRSARAPSSSSSG